jgi:hypothetical protein
VQRPVALDGARPDGLAVVLAPVEVQLNQFAKGLCPRAAVAACQYLGLQPGLFLLGLAPTALNLPAETVRLSRYRVDARVYAHFPPVAALDDCHCRATSG